LHTSYKFIVIFYCVASMINGSCQHGMVCPQFADGGMASSMEGSCKYIG